MANISTDAVIDSIRLKNQAADPSAPAAGYLQMYPKSDALYIRTSSGTVVSIGDSNTHALLAGRSGGQTLNGGTDANDDLILQGTSNSTRTSSYLVMQPDGGKVGIGTSAPAALLHLSAPTGTAELYVQSLANDPVDVARIRLKNNIDEWLLSISNEGGSFAITQVGAGGISFDGAGAVMAGVMQLMNSSSTNSTPTLYIQQNDDDVAMIAFDVSSSTPGAGKPIDTAAIGTYYGKIRVKIQNVGFKFIPLYNS